MFNAVTINSNDLSINQVLYSAAAATPTTAPRSHQRLPDNLGRVDFCRALGGEFGDSESLIMVIVIHLVTSAVLSVENSESAGLLCVANSAMISNRN